MRNKEIIFLDTEFSTLDPYKGEILSIGLVKENGEELYLELEYAGEYNNWVKENLIHTLKDKKISREEAREIIAKFVGANQPIMFALNNAFDVIYTYKLFGTDKCPFFWIPLDFTGILFGLGYDPMEYIANPTQFATNLGVKIWDGYSQHNALDDARLLRETYFALREKCM